MSKPPTAALTRPTLGRTYHPLSPGGSTWRSSGPEAPRPPPTPALPRGVPLPTPSAASGGDPARARSLVWNRFRAHPRGETLPAGALVPPGRAGSGLHLLTCVAAAIGTSAGGGPPGPPLLTSDSLRVQGADRHAPPLRRHGGRRARGSGAAPRPLGAAHAAPARPRLGGGGRGRGPRPRRAWSGPGVHAFVRPRLGLQNLPGNGPGQPRSSSQHRGRPDSPEPGDSPGGRKSRPGQRSLAQCGRGLRAEPSGNGSSECFLPMVSMATAKRHLVGR